MTLVLRNDTGRPLNIKNALTGQELGLGPRGVVQGAGWDHYAGSLLTIVSGTPAPAKPSATTSANVKQAQPAAETLVVPGVGKRLAEEGEPTRPELKPVAAPPAPPPPTEPSVPAFFPKEGKAKDQQEAINKMTTSAELLATRSWYLSTNPHSRNIRVIDDRLVAIGYKK